jgi:hypothetical protein
LPLIEKLKNQWHIRDTSRRILSRASDIQPEPEPDSFSQFARIDEGFLAWHFKIFDRRNEEIVAVNRAFRGFGREVC